MSHYVCMGAKPKEKLENRPWSARPGEKAYDLFLLYLEMPSPRSFSTLARQVGRTSAMVRQNAHRYDWLARAAAFDSHRAARAHEVMFLAAEDRARGILRACDLMLQIGTRRLEHAAAEDELVAMREAVTLVAESQRMAGIADPPKPEAPVQPEEDLPDELTLDQIRELLARETVQ